MRLVGAFLLAGTDVVQTQTETQTQEKDADVTPARCRVGMHRFGLHAMFGWKHGVAFDLLICWCRLLCPECAVHHRLMPIYGVAC